MSTINTNNADLSTRMERLASGLKINSGKDDPAGLIASENLRSQAKGMQQVLDDTNAVQVALENVAASESAIRDADFASEAAALTRAQILVQANMAVLSMANSAPQTVLALLK